MRRNKRRHRPQWRVFFPVSSPSRCLENLTSRALFSRHLSSIVPFFSWISASCPPLNLVSVSFGHYNTNQSPRGARPTGQRPVELTKGKWKDIVQSLQNFQPDRSVPFTFRPKFRLLLIELGLETRIFENGTASFDRTGPIGPPLKVDHFFRKISTWTELFQLCFDRNFRKFWDNGKHPSCHGSYTPIITKYVQAASMRGEAVQLACS